MQPQPQGEPPMQPHEQQAAASPAGPDASAASKLHDHALQAEKHLEALATGLAHASADPSAVKAVQQMADAMRKILAAMNKQAAAAPPPQQRPTMDSATNDLQQQLAANRQKG